MDDEVEGLSVVFEADMGNVSGTPGQFEDVLGQMEDAAASASENISSSLDALIVPFDELGMMGEETGTKITEGLTSSDTGFSDLQDAVAALTGSINSAVDEIDSRLESIGSTAEESASQAQDSFSGFDLGGMINHVGMGIFSLQMMGQVAGQTANALLGPAEAAETTKTAFDNLLGSTQAATDELDKINTFAAKTQFPTQVIDDATASMIAFKIPTETIIPDLTAVGDALSGVGKGTPAELQSVVDILGKMSIAGKLTQGDITELGKHGIDATTAIAQGLGISTDALQTMVKQGTLPAQDAINALTKGIEDNPLYNGGMAKQSGTMAGLMSTLQSNWNQVLAAFGSPIIKALDPLLANIGNDLSSPAFHDFAGSIGQGIVDVFGDIGKAADYVHNIFRSLNLLEFKDAWQSFGVLLSAVEQDISKVGSAFNILGTDADPIAPIIGNVLKGGVDILTKVLYGLDSILLDVDASFQGIKNPITSAGDSLKQFLGPAQDIASMLEGQFTDAFKFAGKEASQISTWFMGSGILQDVGQELQNLGHVVLDLGEIFVKGRGVIQDFEEHTFEKLAPIVERILPPILKLATTIDTDVTQAFTAITPDIMQAEAAIGKFADGVIDRVSPIVEKYLPYIEEGVKDLESAWVQDWPYMQATFNTVWDEIKGSVQVAWSVISGIINVGLDILGGNWNQAWRDMQDSLKGSLRGMEEQWKPLLEGMSNIPGPAGDMAKSVLHAFDDMSDQSQQKSLEMKSKNEQIAIDQADQIVKKYDEMRQQILQKLSQTKDDAEKKALEMQLTQVTHAEDTAKQVVQKHVEMHQQTVSQLDQFKQGATTVWTNISKGVQDVVGDGVKWVQDKWHEGVTFIEDKLRWLYDHNYYFKHMIDDIEKDVENGKKWLHDKWDEIKSDVVKKWDEIKGDGSKKAGELWDNISQPFKDAWSKYLGPPITGAWTTVAVTVDGWKNDATQWGEDIINNLVTGIENAVGSLNTTIDNIGSSIATGLGFHDIGGGTPSTNNKKKTPGHATGILNNPVGHWAIVGEEGPEPMFVPAGASILPNSALSSGGLASFAQSQPLQGSSGGAIKLELHVHIADREIVSTAMVDLMMEQVVKRLRLQGGKMLAV